MSSNINKPAIGPLLNAYMGGEVSPEQVVENIFQRTAEYKEYNIWIHLEDKEKVLQEVEKRKEALRQGKNLPLYCIPFAVKDNIDVQGLLTTAACPGFAYVAGKNAEVVECLLEAGALLIGKTNLDQFATGLVGIRSPYGAVKNAFNNEYISGGSSSGSAVAVALGMVAFSLGTDTAGSGRIPAGFNNLVGLKPGIGTISTQGVVPACKSLDCVSVFAHSPEDAGRVYAIATSRIQQECSAGEREKALSVAVPKQSQLFFEEASGYESLFKNCTDKIVAGFSVKPISFDVFSETAKLLYHGPWVAERMAAIKNFYQEKGDQMHPVVHSIIGNAHKYTATDTFEALYALDDLRKKAREIFQDIDLLMVPTAPGIYTIEETEQNPVELNTRLGYYTNYVNLLGLCAIALPAGFNEKGLPFGITLIASGGKEKQLLVWAERIAGQLKEGLGLSIPSSVPGGYVQLAVAGLHKTNQPLNYQLTDLQATYSYTTSTSSTYRMYAIDPEGKMKPGLVKVRPQEKGFPIEVELWQIPVQNLGIFMTKIPHPLGIGQVELADGAFVYGFICEEYIAAISEDISKYHSWENFLSAKKEKTSKEIL